MRGRQQCIIQTCELREKWWDLKVLSLPYALEVEPYFQTNKGKNKEINVK